MAPVVYQKNLRICRHLITLFVKNIWPAIKKIKIYNNNNNNKNVQCAVDVDEKTTMRSNAMRCDALWLAAQLPMGKKKDQIMCVWSRSVRARQRACGPAAVAAICQLTGSNSIEFHNFRAEAFCCFLAPEMAQHSLHIYLFVYLFIIFMFLSEYLWTQRAFIGSWFQLWARGIWLCTAYGLRRGMLVCL